MLHHSKINGRTINVEFTARGRKSEARDKKIKEKNTKAARFKLGAEVAQRKNRPQQKGKIKVKAPNK